MLILAQQAQRENNNQTNQMKTIDADDKSLRCQSN